MKHTPIPERLYYGHLRPGGLRDYLPLPPPPDRLFRASPKLADACRESAELLHAAPCAFSMCPGPDEPAQDMLTCRVCRAEITLRAALADLEEKP